MGLFLLILSLLAAYFLLGNLTLVLLARLDPFFPLDSEDILDQIFIGFLFLTWPAILTTLMIGGFFSPFFYLSSRCTFLARYLHKKLKS